MGKKFYLAALITLSAALISCGGDKQVPETNETKTPVTLQVSTMYAGNDSNAKTFHEAVAEWEGKTGNKVDDVSSTADEAYKNRIVMEFQTGDEPDVLFYFSGVDADALVANKRVVSIDTIREEYPDYASNMKDSMMQASPYDGKIYAIPVTGYWEALFVNKRICEASGIRIPDKNTTWADFWEMCGKVKAAGHVPIAASLSEVPHYWFEYCIYNHQMAENHAIVPSLPGDQASIAWVQGISDIKALYDNGFFPKDTLSVSDAGAKKLFTEGKAAFLLEGSWSVPWIEEQVINPEDYVVTFFPGNDERKPTDIISGLSTGYYITKKAWDDPEKRDAAVSFVRHMTSDDCVSRFANISATALVNGVSADKESLSSFVLSALEMAEDATATSEAVQDYVATNCRAPIFDNMPAIMKGEVEIREAVNQVIELMRNQSNE